MLKNALSALFIFIALSQCQREGLHLIKFKNHQIDVTKTLGRRSEWPEDKGQNILQTLIHLTNMEASSEIVQICGASNYRYVPENALIVTCGFSQFDKLKKIEEIDYIGPVEPRFKISENWDTTSYKTKDGKPLFKITIAEGFSNSDQETLELIQSLKSLEEYGFELIEVFTNEVVVSINEENQKSLVELATSQEYCSWIQKVPKISKFNLDGRWITQGGTAKVDAMNLKGLDGSGVIIGVADSGLDLNHCFFYDNTQTVNFCRRSGLTATQCTTPNNNHRKVVGYFGIADISEDLDSHGTHVAGTVAGKSFSNTNLNNNQYSSAYNSKIAVVDIFNSQGGVNFDFDGEVLPFLSRMGAVISSNSWGYEQPLNAYNFDSLEIDDYSFKNQGTLIIFASGNDGPGYETIDPHGNSKNGILVGSVEKSQTKLAFYSSRGPTHDGRIKPDVVAPGSSIVSSVIGTPPIGGCNSKVATFDGTSMATPNVAAAAALVYQYYKEGHLCNKLDSCKLNPSSSLVKATLINSAQHFSGGSDFTGSGSAAAIGFGRVKLSDTLDFNQGNLIVFDQVRIELNSLFMKMVTPKQGFSLKVTLAWIDPPGSTNALYNLVNDLDLRVISPSGKIHSGNKYLGFYNFEGDGVNNVEQVLIPSSSIEPGEYKVQVSVYGLGKGTSQNFSLVINLASTSVCSSCAPRCPTSYNCGKENVCIGYDKVCDGNKDCQSGVDEDPKLCLVLRDFTKSCNNNFFTSQNASCNGDCANGFDEENCNSSSILSFSSNFLFFLILSTLFVR